MPQVLTPTFIAFPYGISGSGYPAPPTDGTTGNVYYVSSTAPTGSDTTSAGMTPTTPFKTLAYAATRTVANQGDRIYVMPGHIEAVASAAGIAFGTADLRIIGLGEGRNRPTFTWQSTTAATMDVNVAGVTFENLVFNMAGVDGVVSGLLIKAADCTLLNCELLVSSATAQVVVALLTNANAHRLRILGCRFLGTTHAGATRIIHLVGATDACEIGGNVLTAAASTALIATDAGTANTNFYIHHNALTQYAADTPAIKIGDSGVTGLIAYNTVRSNSVTTQLENNKCGAYENYGYDSDNQNQVAVLIPANGSQLGTSRSLVDELLGASINYNRTNYFAVTADLSAAAWNTVAKHAIATVSGACRIRILPVCTEDLTGGGTLQLGFGASTATYIAATTATAIDANEVWLSITPAADFAYTSVIDRVVNATAVGYEILTSAVTDGTIVFHVWFEPLSSTGSVAAGTGATF